MPRIKKIELSNGLYVEYGHLILSTCLVQTLRSLLWNTVYLVTIHKIFGLWSATCKLCTLKY